MEKTEAVTREDPQIVPKMVQLKTVAIPNPPRIFPIHCRRVEKIFVLSSPTEAR